MIIEIKPGHHLNPAHVASMAWETSNAVGADTPAIRTLVISTADGGQHRLGHFPDQGQDAEAIATQIIEALK